MKISVLTICLNAEKYINRAIQSVINQDYDEVEHIIVDGGSKDSTINIIGGYNHIIWISEKDNGQSDAMNKAFKLSKGDLIVYLNADDYFEPNIFKDVANTFSSTGTDIVVGNLIIKNESTNQSTFVNTNNSFRKIVLPDFYPFPYNPVSYFYKRRVQEEIGDFPLEEHYAMDYWFLLRALDRFKSIKINQYFGTFYLSGNNKTCANTNIDLNSIATNYIKEKGKIKLALFKFSYIYHILISNIKNQKPIRNGVKYLFYYFGYKDKYLSFSDFNAVGFKKILFGK